MTPWVGTTWPSCDNLYNGYGNLQNIGLGLFADELGNAGAFGSYAGQPNEMHHIAPVMKNCMVCIAKEPTRVCELTHDCKFVTMKVLIRINVYYSGGMKPLQKQVTHDRNFHFMRDSDGMNICFGVVANSCLTHDVKLDTTKDSEHNIRDYKMALQYGAVVPVTGQRVPSQCTATLTSSSSSSSI